MQLKNASEIQSYWNQRADSSNGHKSATTEDVFLRELEIKTLYSSILSLRKNSLIKILDIGCGDGYSTIELAKKIDNASFIGVDYSEQMIKNAKNNLYRYPELKDKILFQTGDVTKIAQSLTDIKFDFIMSDRCLINLVSTEAQYHAIEQINELLLNDGAYLAIENFEEGQKALNSIRNNMGLPPIEIRWHNLFFNQNEFITRTKKIFKQVDVVDFSSAYYFATRVIYSKYCQMENTKPQYDHKIHQIAVDLPAYGNYSPIKLAVLIK